MANRRFIDFPIASTVGDNDIVLIWQDGANKQTTKATILSGLPENLDELNDVVISGLTNGQILRYDSVTGKWVNTDQGNLDLNDLNDVSIVSPSNGQVLVYNSSTSKWENSSGGFVPYVGAVTTVDLGAQGLRAGYVRFDTSVVTVPDEQGLMYWDASRSTVALIMNGTLQHIGQDSFFYVKNSSGSTIPKGTCVGFAGTEGGSGHLLVTPFLANGSVPSTYFMGVTSEEIANGSFGQVMHFGELTGINTSGFTVGALLYASSTVAGGFQTTAPVAPNNIILVAAAVNSKNNGAIVVRPTLGSNFGTNESVKLTSVTDKDLLQYTVTAGVGLWENKTLSQVIGSAYVPSTRTLTINGVTQDLSANRTFNVGTVTSVGLSSATSGVTIGSTPVTSSGTITLAIATASGSQQGLLSAADWTTFNNKQNALTNPVTGTGASGQVAYFTGTTAISSESNLFWDATNDRLGIGNAVPVNVLSIHQNNASSSTTIELTNTSTGNNTSKSSRLLFVLSDTVGTLKETAFVQSIPNDVNAVNADLVFGTRAADNFPSTKMQLYSDGNLFIGSSPSNNGAKLQVSGNQTLTGKLLINSTDTTKTPLLLNAEGNYASSGNMTTGFAITNTSFGRALNMGVFESGAYAWIQAAYINNADTTFSLTLQPSGGNLLVGTTSDNGARLQVSGNLYISRSSNPYLTIDDTGVNSEGGILFKPSGFNSKGGLTINYSTAEQRLFVGEGGNSYFQTFYTNGSERMRITSSGQLILNSTTAGGGTKTTFNVIENGGIQIDSSEGATQRYIEFTTGGTTKMLIAAGGNVLIGTTTDAGYKLDVNGSTQIRGGSSFAGLILNDSRAGGVDFAIYNGFPAAGDFTIRESGVGNYLVIKKTTGAATFSSLGTGTVYSNGGTLTNTNPSDFNLKENITPINYGLSEILQLNAVTFNWKNDTINQGKQYGFIAQEVQKIMPDLVKKGEYLGLDKEAIFTTLVKAIQELKQEIDTLKN